MFLFSFYFGNKFPKITEIIIPERFFMMRIRGDSGHKIHNRVSHNLEVGPVYLIRGVQKLFHQILN